MKSRISKIVFLLAVAGIALIGINTKTETSVVATEVEPEMEIETWMVDAYFWNKESIDLAPAAEKDLSIEAWMYDDNYWM